MVTKVNSFLTSPRNVMGSMITQNRCFSNGRWYKATSYRINDMNYQIGTKHFNIVALTRYIRSNRITRIHPNMIRLFHQDQDQDQDQDQQQPHKSITKIDETTKHHIGIVGGGLAGLSVAYHLLMRSTTPIQISILDTSDKPGINGASSVAGGLLHPFSPRGKILPLGLEALECSNKLIEAARLSLLSSSSSSSSSSSKDDDDDDSIVLRDCLYRIALTERNVNELKETSKNHPNIASWMSSSDIRDIIHGIDDINENNTQSPILGGIQLHGGCKVIHVPSYLQGLWKACQSLCQTNGPNENDETLKVNDKQIEWIQKHIGNTNKSNKETDDMQMQMQMQMNMENEFYPYDTVILTAGAGLWHDFILDRNAFSKKMELVRGQSIQIKIPEQSTNIFPMEAILCGKYITPLPPNSSSTNDVCIGVGATHEYKDIPLSPTNVIEELKKRSYNLHPKLWDDGIVDTEDIKSGWRVQSARSNFGRMPIVGRIHMNKDHDLSNTDTDDDEAMKYRNERQWKHDNVWTLTGLSSRGLIYHGIYGDILAQAILTKNGEEKMFQTYPHLSWWK